MPLQPEPRQPRQALYRTHRASANTHASALGLPTTCGPRPVVAQRGRPVLPSALGLVGEQDEAPEDQSLDMPVIQSFKIPAPPPDLAPALRSSTREAVVTFGRLQGRAAEPRDKVMPSRLVQQHLREVLTCVGRPMIALKPVPEIVAAQEEAERRWRQGPREAQPDREAEEPVEQPEGDDGPEQPEQEEEEEEEEQQQQQQQQQQPQFEEAQVPVKPKAWFGSVIGGPRQAAREPEPPLPAHLQALASVRPSSPAAPNLEQLVALQVSELAEAAGIEAEGLRSDDAAEAQGLIVDAKKVEKEKEQEQAEKQRQEQEKQRQQEAEKQRKEAEKQRKEAEEKLRQEEAEKQRKEAEEKLRQEEAEKQRKEEEEKQRQEARAREQALLVERLEEEDAATRVLAREEAKEALIAELGRAAEQKLVREREEAEAAEGARPLVLYGTDVDQDKRVLGAVQEALDWLSEKHVSEEGLWRKAGNKRETTELIRLAEEQGRFPLEQVDGSHNLTSMLVQLLQALPGGLLDGPLVHSLLAQHELGGTADQFVGLLSERLPRGKRVLLAMLLRHWRCVIAAENRMDASAMATCVFAVLAPDMPSYMNKMNQVMQLVGQVLSCSDQALEALDAPAPPLISPLKSAVQGPEALAAAQLLEALGQSSIQPSESVLSVAAVFGVTDLAAVAQLQDTPDELALFEQVCAVVQHKGVVELTEVEECALLTAFEHLTMGAATVGLPELHSSFSKLQGLYELRSDDVIHSCIHLCSAVDRASLPAQLDYVEFKHTLIGVLQSDPRSLCTVLPESMLRHQHLHHDSSVQEQLVSAVEGLFQALDTDQDQMLAFNEFEAALGRSNALMFQAQICGGSRTAGVSKEHFLKFFTDVVACDLGAESALQLVKYMGTKKRLLPPKKPSSDSVVIKRAHDLYALLNTDNDEGVSIPELKAVWGDGASSLLQLDTDQDGNINHAEWIEFWERAEAERGTQMAEFQLRLLEARISQAAALRQRRIRKDKPAGAPMSKRLLKKVTMCFEMVDEDGSGAIAKQELFNCAEVKDNTEMSTLLSLWTDLDTSEDGEVSMSEWLGYWQAHNQKEGEQSTEMRLLSMKQHLSMALNNPHSRRSIKRASESCSSGVSTPLSGSGYGGYSAH